MSRLKTPENEPLLKPTKRGPLGIKMIFLGSIGGSNWDGRSRDAKVFQHLPVIRVMFVVFNELNIWILPWEMGYLKQLPLSWSKPSTVMAWTVQFQRGWSRWTCLGVESYDVRSLPNATTSFWSVRSGTFSHKKATIKVPNLYILLVMARSRSKSLRCVNVFRWMWMFSTMLLPHNGWFHFHSFQPETRREWPGSGGGQRYLWNTHGTAQRDLRLHCRGGDTRMVWGSGFVLARSMHHSWNGTYISVSAHKHNDHVDSYRKIWHIYA